MSSEESATITVFPHRVRCKPLDARLNFFEKLIPLSNIAFNHDIISELLQKLFNLFSDIYTLSLEPP